MEVSKEKLVDLLKSHDLRVTEKRIGVLRIIQGYGSAIPHSKIQELLKKFDRVTLYRTILTLVESGIIHKIQVEDQEVFYALCGQTCNTQEHHHEHIHFHCSECETVSCVEPMKQLQVQLEGYHIMQVNIQVNGVCAECTAG